MRRSERRRAVVVAIAEPPSCHAVAVLGLLGLSVHTIRVRMSIFFDIYQQGKIAVADAKAEHAKSESERLRQQVQDLQRKCDGLTIACQSLWEIVRDRAGIGDEALLAKMQEVDLRDGQADGKISPALASCPSCGRRSNAARKLCLYCGASMPVAHVFGSH